MLQANCRCSFRLRFFGFVIHFLSISFQLLYLCNIYLLDLKRYSDVVLDLMFNISDVPSKPPGKPKVAALSPYELQVSWQESETDNNSPIIEYKILVR